MAIQGFRFLSRSVVESAVVRFLPLFPNVSNSVSNTVEERYPLDITKSLNVHPFGKKDIDSLPYPRSGEVFLTESFTECFKGSLAHLVTQQTEGYLAKRFVSTKVQRRRMMNKHKHRKRLKKNRNKTKR